MKTIILALCLLLPLVSFAKEDGKVYNISIVGELSQKHVFEVEKAVKEAKKGDAIHLFIHSGGGDVFYLDKILKAMVVSKAVNITTVPVSASSAAAIIFCHGDIRNINHKANIMFHVFREHSYIPFRKPYLIKKGNWLNERQTEALRMFRAMMKRCNTMLSVNELQRVEEGEDVVIKGSTVNRRLSNG